MNRRQFFGMTVAAVAAAGLPALVLPDRTLFLPPRGGWYPSNLRMRETKQYLINTDSLATRWDVLVSNGAGDHYQVTSSLNEWIEDEHERAVVREHVRQGMADSLSQTRYAHAKVVTHALKLYPVCGSVYV